MGYRKYGMAVYQGDRDNRNGELVILLDHNAEGWHVCFISDGHYALTSDGSRKRRIGQGWLEPVA